MRNFADIDRRKQRENERLNDADKDRERQQNDRHQNLGERREKSRNDRRYLFICEHIREQTQTKRHRPDHITEQLDHKDQRRHKDRQQQRQFRTRKMAEVFDQTVLGNADVVIVNERCNGQRERNVNGCGRRHEHREQAHQVRH